MLRYSLEIFIVSFRNYSFHAAALHLATHICFLTISLLAGTMFFDASNPFGRFFQELHGI